MIDPLEDYEALNDACWVMLEHLHKNGGPISDAHFKDFKAFLKSAIETYLEHKAKDVEE